MVLILSGAVREAAAEEVHALETLRRTRAKAYVTRDGKPLLADVYQPPGDGPFPTVLMVHGGAWAAGSKWTVLRHANRMAQHGYAVVAINYRLAPAHKFPAQLEDCRAALAWIRKNAADYQFDVNRIGAYGYSAGGHLVALLGVTEPEQAEEERRRPCVQAVVAGGAPCSFDWLPEESRGLAYFLGGSRAERPHAYQNASPISFVNPKAPPFFFFHGDKDQLVPLSSSQSFHRSLVQAGVDSTFHVIKNTGHLMAFHDSNSLQQAIRFFDKHLKPDHPEQGGEEDGDDQTSDDPTGDDDDGKRAAGTDTGSESGDSESGDPESGDSESGSSAAADKMAKADSR